MQLLQKQQLLDRAIQVANQLEKRAVHHWDFITWLNKDKRPLGYHLYDGCSGIALFFSALYKQTGERKYRQRALKAINPLHKSNFSYFHHGKNPETDAIGVTVGYPSYIYALLLISEFLQEDLYEDVNYYLSFITSETIVKDQSYDVMHGAAGIILSLLKAFEANEQIEAIEMANVAGEHLVQRFASQSIHQNQNILTGFSHGAAGVSYSLMKLFAQTQEEQFQVVGKDLIDYERSVYSVEHKNWPDFRSGKIDYLNSWCHGATGIGLSRLGCLTYGRDEEMLTEIDRVFELINEDSSTDLLHLCCGNFGRLEFLITLLQKKGNKVIEQHAFDYLANIFRTTDLAKLLNDPHLSSRLLPSGFFTGLAGIGYQFLRMLDPNSYPSILLFE